MERIYIFKRFERFWHWSQALLIMIMLLTGFEIHGTYHLFGFASAGSIHTTAAWVLITLWVFAIFWHFTTGEWRQYIPTGENLTAMIRYYLTGIFQNAPHPFRVSQLRKHNPLQRLAYLGVKVIINPLIWISGLVYLFYNELDTAGHAVSLEAVALLHTVGAFMMLIFLIGHLYMITTGHTWSSQIKAMITGWEEIEHEGK
ncbi:MAG TPA: cytochrome b/b6 domain-containing protein [Accumulibacter sp.]|jgi:thiosulfate reductase cytochrome b subunit|nr:cytochrome b/b6 domain-containing protein [Accumulibacter sp.]